MRPHHLVRLALLAPALGAALCACAGKGHAASAAAAPSGSPVPLGSCETREVVLDGAHVVVSSNADGSLASVAVIDAPDRQARAGAVDDAEHDFGPVRRDARVIARQSKWGLTTYTDPCGRPVTGGSPQ